MEDTINVAIRAPMSSKGASLSAAQVPALVLTTPPPTSDENDETAESVVPVKTAGKRKRGTATATGTPSQRDEPAKKQKTTPKKRNAAQPAAESQPTVEHPTPQKRKRGTATATATDTPSQRDEPAKKKTTTSKKPSTAHPAAESRPTVEHPTLQKKQAWADRPKWFPYLSAETAAKTSKTFEELFPDIQNDKSEDPLERLECMRQRLAYLIINKGQPGQDPYRLRGEARRRDAEAATVTIDELSEELLRCWEEHEKRREKPPAETIAETLSRAIEAVEQYYYYQDFDHKELHRLFVLATAGLHGAIATVASKPARRSQVKYTEPSALTEEEWNEWQECRMMEENRKDEMSDTDDEDDEEESEEDVEMEKEWEAVKGRYGF